MGTKRPSHNLFDNLFNFKTNNHKIQTGGKSFQDSSAGSKMISLLEQERENKREETIRRETETEKVRDKARPREMDSLERHAKERTFAPQPRDGDKEWRERERRQEDDRGKNSRPLVHIKKDIVQDRERGKKKGDTFPRMRKGKTDLERKRISSAEMVEERCEMNQTDHFRGREMEDWDRERQRYREREWDDIRSRVREEGRNPGGRSADEERSWQRERYKASAVQPPDRIREGVDYRDIRERDGARKRDMEVREVRRNSPHRRPDREAERGERRERRRDARSEGDSDERELRRERMRDKDRDELFHQFSRSEGDNRGKMPSDRDRDKRRYRERDVDKSRRREREDRIERYREADGREERYPDREGDRWKESGRGFKHYRREDDRYREERRDTEIREGRRGRESGTLSDSAPRALPRGQSSGEWSSDMDSETKHRRDTYERRAAGREKRGDRERRKEGPRDFTSSERQQVQSERKERDGRGMISSLPEQRRMWLEPQRGKNSKDECVDRERQTRRKEGRSEEKGNMEAQADWGRDERRAKGEPHEGHKISHQGRPAGRDEYRGDLVGLSVDGEEEGQIWREGGTTGKEHLSDSDRGMVGTRQRNVEGENLTDNTEESDREEEGGSDHWARSESEGGSEAEWRQDSGRVLSEEDGFVTPSSGGDEEDEGGDDEEEFKDCQEMWEGGNKSLTPSGFKQYEGDGESEEEWTFQKEESVDEEEQGREKKFVFCVIGQRTSEMSQSLGSERGGAEGERENVETQTHNRDDLMHNPSDDCHLTSKRNDDPPATVSDQQTGGDYWTPKEETPASGDASEGDITHRVSSELRGAEPGEERQSGEVEPHLSKIKRDSQTERLLKEWREKNKEPTANQHSPASNNPSLSLKSCGSLEEMQPFLDQMNTETMSPEELEAIRIRMSGAWSISEEPKRHSQAPHLKWAKDVVREILGKSEEHDAEEPNKDTQEDHEGNQSGTKTESSGVTLTKDVEHLEPEKELMEDFRGMGQSHADMHADQVKAMHVVTPTYTHADTLVSTGGKDEHTADQNTDGSVQSEQADLAELQEREKEVEMYLSVSNTLYKHNSCPILNFHSESDLITLPKEGKSQEERQGEEPEDSGVAEQAVKTKVENGEGEEIGEKKKVTVKSSCSFRDLGPEARLRRRGIRKTTERRNGELQGVEEEVEEGVGRDRRARVFPPTDEEDDRSKSWEEVELRNVLDTIERRKRNSKIFNASPLYQQYSEAAQNIEILRQSRSDVLSVCEEHTPSPVPSPPPARRPLPPLPVIPHPHSLSHKDSITSCKSLPLPEPPKNEGRPSSPRLSISLTQSATLWRDLPAVRNSSELGELGEDETRLQEVRFEVVTSEASYCRSLDVVVDHFVKSKQLGALLTTQDRNWLFSRLADVRAISHSFLTKLEERVESDIMHFTVCDIIAQQCKRFKMVYVPYLTNQSYQDATYQRLMNENQEFKRIVEKLERSPVCQRLPLRSFLVLPFQRITRIKLLVQNIVKRTAPGTPEAAHAITALRRLEKLIQESNDSISQMKSIESLVSLSAKVDFECRTLPLVSQSRRLVREGPVTELMDFSLKDTERSAYLHLFNDYLLLSLQKEGGRFTVIDHSPVSELRVENCRVKLHSLQKNLFRLYMSQKSLLLRTNSQSDKLRWISALSRPHTEIDFSAAQDFVQMQCIRAFVAQQPDELSLEKADVILVHQESSDNWVEGTRLSDRHRGWLPKSHLETISSSRIRKRNLSDALKLTTATAAELTNLGMGRDSGMS